MPKPRNEKKEKGKPKNCKQNNFNPQWCGRYAFCIGCQKNNNKSGSVMKTKGIRR